MNRAIAMLLARVWRYTTILCLCGATSAVHATATVSLTAPANGAQYVPPANITLSATASAGGGYTLSKVEFFYGTTLIGTDTTSPYSITWNNAPSGQHAITAKATAIKKNSPDQTATSAAANITVNAPPVVTLAEVGGQYIPPPPITLTATASDSDGTIVSVEFREICTLNQTLATATTPPYTFVWTIPPPYHPGTGGIHWYCIEAIATDNLGGQSDWGVWFPLEPVLTLTGPSNGAVYTAPATIQLSATLSPPDFPRQGIKFHHGEWPFWHTLIGEDSTEPYSFAWENVLPGTYSLTAFFENELYAGISPNPVTVTVSMPAPQGQLHFIHPDHLGTPRLIADQNQQTVWRWDQAEPFGDNVPTENVAGFVFDFPLRFPGQYADKETNLHYNMMRDYDPGIGRYIESDPIGLRGGINTYLYATDPLTQIDPEGLMGYRGGKSTSDYSSCGYYDNVAANVGCKYHGWAAGACRGQNAGVEFMSNICMITTAQMNCIRRCLVEEDQNARGRNECKVCTDRGACTRLSCINDYHKKCFAKCNVSTYCYGGRYWQGFPNDGDSPGQGQCCGK